MTDKKKKRVRALSSKTGMSHQAAVNVLRGGTTEESNYGYHNPNFPVSCKGCGKPLLMENLFVDDGCPCNTPRGVNFEPKPCALCRTDDCVKPGHRTAALYGVDVGVRESRTVTPCCERDHDGDGNCDRHPAKPGKKTLEIGDDDLAVVFEQRVTPHPAGGPPAFSLKNRVFAGGRQLGMVSDFDLHMSSDRPWPNIDIEFVGGPKTTFFNQLSEPSQKALHESIEALRRFLFVRISSPLGVEGRDTFLRDPKTGTRIQVAVHNGPTPAPTSSPPTDDDVQQAREILQQLDLAASFVGRRSNAWGMTKDQVQALLDGLDKASGTIENYFSGEDVQEDPGTAI